MSRDRAWQILTEYSKNPSLLRHALCVEAAMRWYARKYGEDEEKWGAVGLLHDFDYERFPNPADHTTKGAEILRGAGFDEEIIAAIQSHVPWNTDRFPRNTLLRKAIFAVDELCGLIYAAALVRPTKFDGLTARSVLKKMKEKSFAAAVSREDIQAGAELLGLPLDEHVANCVTAICGISASLAETV